VCTELLRRDEAIIDQTSLFRPKRNSTFRTLRAALVVDLIFGAEAFVFAGGASVSIVVRGFEMMARVGCRLVVEGAAFFVFSSVATMEVR
jgi:hypothetical protein